MVKPVSVKAVRIKGILPALIHLFIFNSGRHFLTPYNETQMPELSVMCVIVWAHLNSKCRIWAGCLTVGEFQLLTSPARSLRTESTFLTWLNEN